MRKRVCYSVGPCTPALSNTPRKEVPLSNQPCSLLTHLRLSDLCAAHPVVCAHAKGLLRALRKTVFGVSRGDMAGTHGQQHWCEQDQLPACYSTIANALHKQNEGPLLLTSHCHHQEQHQQQVAFYSLVVAEFVHQALEHRG